MIGKRAKGQDKLTTQIEDSNKEMTDVELVASVMAGNRESFSMLVLRHQKPLMRLCLRFMKEASKAEDVVQEAFIKAYEKLGSFEGRSSFRSWLFQIAVNTAKNKLRERSDRGPSIDDVHLAVMPEAESKAVHLSVADILKDYVDRLPHRQKTALILRVYEDMSFAEIADVMDCPYDTAKANYRHALLKLKDELSKQADLRHWTEETGFLFQFHQKVAEVET